MIKRSISAAIALGLMVFGVAAVATPAVAQSQAYDHQTSSDGSIVCDFWHEETELRWDTDGAIDVRIVPGPGGETPLALDGTWSGADRDVEYTLFARASETDMVECKVWLADLATPGSLVDGGDDGGGPPACDPRKERCPEPSCDPKKDKDCCPPERTSGMHPDHCEEPPDPCKEKSLLGHDDCHEPPKDPCKDKRLLGHGHDCHEPPKDPKDPKDPKGPHDSPLEVPHVDNGDSNVVEDVLDLVL